MSGTLELLLVALVASSTLGVTIAAWRARRTTPRTISLVLSAGACFSIVVAAGDCAIPLPRALCLQEVSAEPGALEAALEDKLGGWGWWLRPCGRLAVTVQPGDLAASIDFGKLTAMAVEAGLVVDVRLGDGVPRDERELELVYDDPDGSVRRLPISTPIPAAHTDARRIRPTIQRLDAPATCRIGLDATAKEPSLDVLLEGRSEAAYQGFHRLQCWPAGREEVDEPTTGYVQVRTAPVVVVSDAIAPQTRNEIRFEAGYAEDPALFGLSLIEWVGEDERVRGGEENTLVGASMIVFDRPSSAASCDRAKALLDRGGAVVLAMPGDDCIEAGKAWLPIQPETNDVGASLSFDRRPRLTFVLDDFAEDLDTMPSCIIESEEGCRTLSGSLPPSLEEVQLGGARVLCDQLKGGLLGHPDCTLPTSAQIGRADTYDPVVVVRREPFEAASDRERIDHSSAASALLELAKSWRNSRVLWEEELVVVFTHDPSRPDPSHPVTALQEFMDRSGARVHVAPIVDPYGTSLRMIYPEVAHRIALTGAAVLTALPARRVSISSDSERPTDTGERFLLPITKSIGQAAATHAAWRPRLHSRFVDAEFKAGKSGITSAPVQFSWWGPIRGERHVSAAELAHTTADESGLIERPLAVGAMVGPGHLLLLSYSPLEALSRDEPWPETPKADVDVLQGLDLIRSLYLNTKDFRAELHGPVLSVLPRPDGALWINVVAPDDPGQDLMIRRFSPSVTSRPVGEDHPGGDPVTPLVAPLVDFDSARGVYTYALPASDLDTLRECRMYRSDLGGAPIHVCPPGTHGGPVTRADAALGYKLLAHYSGGRVLGPDDIPDDDSLHSRPLGLGALSLLFLIGWGRRARRRLAARRAYHRLCVVEQVHQRRFDPPDAVVAAAGDWDGRSSTWPRTGAFGGYRPLEPGDRTSAILLQDLVLGANGGPQVLPRVSQRIEEAAPSVLILVNLGASMRVPEHDERGKARFAGRVALHLAATSWRIGGEVTIRSVGVAGDPEIVAPMRVSPGHEELEANLGTRLHQRPSPSERPWPEDLPECGAVIYISDFQLEDERVLQEWLARVEGEGIRVGGVMVFSPLELAMIEGGRLAGSGVWADRADWDPDDVFEAFSRRRDQIERIFDMVTTGGLMVADTTYGQEDIEAILLEGRLLQILR